MLEDDSKYAALSDEEWIEIITSPTTDEKYHRYFFYVKCIPLLRYLARKLYNNGEYLPLMGEFYEFLSDNDWAILRKWEKNIYTIVFVCRHQPVGSNSSCSSSDEERCG